MGNSEFAYFSEMPASVAQNDKFASFFGNVYGDSPGILARIAPGIYVEIYDVYLTADNVLGISLGFLPGNSPKFSPGTSSGVCFSGGYHEIHHLGIPTTLQEFTP